MSDYELLTRRLELLHPIRCQQQCEICEAATALRAMMLREQTARQWMQHKRGCIQDVLKQNQKAEKALADNFGMEIVDRCTCGLDAFLKESP